MVEQPKMPRKGKVLAVEDERTSLLLLTSVLKTEGFEVMTATSGEPALAQVAAETPDLILLDIQMPGIDGFEVCRRLKAEERTRHIPIIFISAATQTTERVQGFKLGAVDFVSKPFQRDELLARVHAHISIARMRSELARQAEDLQAAKETMQRSEERLSMALEAARMGTWELDLASGKIWRSHIFEQIFGYDSPQADWDRETLLRHVVPEEQEKVRQCMLAVKENGGVRCECRIMRMSDRMERWIEIQGQSYRDEQGAPHRIMGVVVDITEQKLAEQERRAMDVQRSLSQKLESVGRLAAGVAHEINTPVQFINDNTRFLKGAMDSINEVLAAHQALAAAVTAGQDTAAALAGVRAAEEKHELDYLRKEMPQTFEETVSGLQRVTQIVKSLKEFAHPNQASKQPADINKGINTTIAVSRHEWKYVADIVTELDPELPPVPVVIDEINQVVLNMIVNAAHAVGDAIKLRGEPKGRITIRTKTDGHHAFIEIEDNGTGIPASAQAHIFEPFFTTKGVGKGTGQGLAIIRTIIVKNHGGNVHFTTEPGKGTTFHIALPLAASEAKEQAA